MKCSWIFFVLFIAVAFTSCYSPRYLYNPSTQNIPVLIKKGDQKLAAYYSTNLTSKATYYNYGNTKTNSSGAFDLHGAYAITDHLAIQAQYSKRTEQNFADYNFNSSDTSIQRFNNRMTELGIGYFTFMRSNKRVVFQMFAGFGKGISSFTDSYQSPGNAIHSRFVEVDISRFYLQPAFMVRYKNNFVTSFSSRVSFIYLRNIKTDYDDQELKAYKLSNLDNETNIFWEPAFSNVLNIKKIPGLQVEMQMGISFLLSQRLIDYRSFNFSAGLVLDLAKMIKANKRSQKN